MANNPEVLDLTFRALADPTRRAVVEALTDRGSSTVTELAAPFQIGLPTFLKHLKVLEASGVIVSTKTGRTRTCRLRHRPLTEAEAWLTRRRTGVAEQLDTFAAYAEQIARPQEDSDVDR